MPDGAFSSTDVAADWRELTFFYSIDYLPPLFVGSLLKVKHAPLARYDYDASLIGCIIDGMIMKT